MLLGSISPFLLVHQVFPDVLPEAVEVVGRRAARPEIIFGDCRFLPCSRTCDRLGRALSTVVGGRSRLPVHLFRRLAALFRRGHGLPCRHSVPEIREGTVQAPRQLVIEPIERHFDP
eukprot:scaffold102_cov340-Pavlova_lutheri.AAC.4